MSREWPIVQCNEVFNPLPARIVVVEVDMVTMVQMSRTWGRILTFAYARNLRRSIFSDADKTAETYLSYASRLLLRTQASKPAKDSLLVQLK